MPDTCGRAASLLCSAQLSTAPALDQPGASQLSTLHWLPQAARLHGAPDICIACSSSPDSRLCPAQVEEPTVRMNFLVNTSPFAGKEGKFVTTRNIKDRLQRELERNLALRVEAGETADAFVVSGRGALHISILIENMRREGFEFGVGPPRVSSRADFQEPFCDLGRLLVTALSAQACLACLLPRQMTDLLPEPAEHTLTG